MLNRFKQFIKAQRVQQKIPTPKRHTRSTSSSKRPSWLAVELLDLKAQGLATDLNGGNIHKHGKEAQRLAGELEKYLADDSTEAFSSVRKYITPRVM